MRTISIKQKAGVFAENKDIASAIRADILLPVLRDNEEVVLDFADVEGATQSFLHAMISEALREFGPEVLDHMIFKNCNDSVRGVIEIVTDYMQESL